MIKTVSKKYPATIEDLINFFLLFIVFRAVYLPVQRLLIPHPGSFCLGAEVFWCQKRGKCARTSRDKTVLYSPRAVRMGREIGVFMLVMLIAGLGAAADPGTLRESTPFWVQPHLFASLFGSVLIVIAYMFQIVSIRENSAIVDQILAEVQKIRQDKGLDQDS